VYIYDPEGVTPSVRHGANLRTTRMPTVRVRRSTVGTVLDIDSSQPLRSIVVSDARGRTLHRLADQHGPTVRVGMGARAHGFYVVSVRTADGSTVARRIVVGD
jgi:hypothetical protein